MLLHTEETVALPINTKGLDKVLIEIYENLLYLVAYIRIFVS